MGLVFCRAFHGDGDLVAFFNAQAHQRHQLIELCAPLSQSEGGGGVRETFGQLGQLPRWPGMDAQVVGNGVSKLLQMLS